MVLSIVVFTLVGREPFWWLITSRIVLVPLVAALSYEVIRFSGKYPDNPLRKVITVPNLALQSLTTRKPEDDQIEIAIAAMQLAIATDLGNVPSEFSEPTPPTESTASVATDAKKDEDL